MLNLGFIGDINLLKPYVKLVRKNPKIHIVGKSSFGTKLTEDDFRFSIPEFNRIELIERSDILVINHFSILPFNLTCKSVKKGKHIFAAGYPGYNKSELEELAELVKEAGIIFQLSNPLFNHPVIWWIKNNIKPPAYWDITYYKKEILSKDDLLTRLLMLLQELINAPLRKINALSFKNPPVLPEFINLRLEYGNAVVVNLNTGSHSSKEYIIKACSAGCSALMDFGNKIYTCNESKIDPSEKKFIDEFDRFIENIRSKKQPVIEIDDYLKVLQNITSIKLKLSQFSDS